MKTYLDLEQILYDEKQEQNQHQLLLDERRDVSFCVERRC